MQLVLCIIANQLLAAEMMVALKLLVSEINLVTQLRFSYRSLVKVVFFVQVSLLLCSVDFSGI